MRTKCKFEGCVNDKQLATGLCLSHQKQLDAGKELAPLREWHKRPEAPAGHAYCNKCHYFKPLDEFYKLKSGKTRHLCKPCQLIANAESLRRAKERQNA